MPLDVDDLIAQARAGASYAGPFLVSIYGERILGYARAIGSDLSDTDLEMVCESAIEKAVRKIDVFDPSKGSFFSWLRGFVRFGILDWRRGQQRVIESSPLLDFAEASEASVPDDHEEGRREAVRKTLQSLSISDQTILLLHNVELLNFREIATRLGSVTESAVRKRHQRAAARLRAGLTEKLATAEISPQGDQDD